MRSGRGVSYHGQGTLGYPLPFHTNPTTSPLHPINGQTGAKTLPSRILWNAGGNHLKFIVKDQKNNNNFWNCEQAQVLFHRFVISASSRTIQKQFCI